MADPTTPNRGLFVPTRGSDVGTWDVPLNGNFQTLDTMVGATVLIDITSSANVFLTPAQLACGTIVVAGTNTQNVSIVWPDTVTGWWSVQNLSNPNFLVLLQTTPAFSEIICAPPGEQIDIQVNFSTVRYRNLGRVGSYLDYAGATVPQWMQSCTIAPYLVCNGTAFDTTEYPTLAAILQSNTLPDFRGRMAAYMDAGIGNITVAGSGINGNALFFQGGTQLAQAHSHTGGGTTTIESNDHTHNYIVPNGNSTTGGGTFQISGPPAGGTTSGASQFHTHSYSFTTNTFGGGGFQNMPPVIMSGIRMIRAA